MSILISWLGPLRAICMAIDGIVFSLLDNAYMLVIKLSTAELFQHETIRSITNNLYILFGVVAFFRLALVLVNAIIDPEKLNEKGKGLSNIFFRVVGMIVLLAVTPFLFQLSYDLQKRIVGSDPEQNLIFKTLLGDNANISGENAGKALQNIALSSLITIDKNYLKAGGKTCQSESDTDCGFMPLTCVPNGDGTCTNQGGYIFGDECTWDNCQKAVSRYNEMYVNEDMKPSVLARSAGVSKKIEIDGEKEEVYVYNYMFIITAFVGGFMTYIIISFAIDIAVRMFELFVLEVLSPLFIATFVDPKSAQSGPFKNWLSAVGKSYANLYIKLAILALMILLVNQSKIFTAMSDLGGWVKIFAVIGLLIFAKKAPKWIMDMIGIKGDESGLGGLSIGKKLGGMALAGGLVKKAGEGIKKQGKKTWDNTKKRLGNKGDRLLASAGAKQQARKNYTPNPDKGRYANWKAKQADAREKSKAVNAQMKHDFDKANDFRWFATARDKYAAGAQAVNPDYETGRDKKLSRMSIDSENLKAKAKIDTSSMSSKIKDANDYKKAKAVYGDIGSLDEWKANKSYYPTSGEKINNEYNRVLGHNPTSADEIRVAKFCVDNGVSLSASDMTDFLSGKINITTSAGENLSRTDVVSRVMEKENAYQTLLYEQTAFSNVISNSNDYEQSKKLYEETREKMLDLISKRDAASDADKPKFTAAITELDTNMNAYKKTMDDSDKARVDAIKEKMIKEGIDPTAAITNTGNGNYTIDIGNEKIDEFDRSVVEISGKFYNKYGKYEKNGNTWEFIKQDMSEYFTAITNELNDKKTKKYDNKLEEVKKVYEASTGADKAKES